MSNNDTVVVGPALLGSVLVLVSAPANTAPRVRYDGHKVVRTAPGNDAEIETILELADDVWTERVGFGPLDVRIAPDKMAALDATGIHYEVVVDDVQVRVDAELTRLTTAPAPLAVDAWYDDFRTLAEIEGRVDQLATDRPDLVEVLPVGQSLDGNPIRALKITGPGSDKAAIVYTGTMHAREWLSPMVTMCIADELVDKYDSDARIGGLLDELDVYVLPVINPDGYLLTWNSDRYWRKNTRGGYGVDLNRNWGYEWGGAGASPDPGDENFRGEGPFSEPESQVVSDFMAARPELVAHIDFHSFSELILYPWGYGFDEAPDEPALRSLAESMSDAIEATHGRFYQPMQGAELYPASGAVDDWSYGAQGMMAFTIELRGNDFVIDPAQIVPTCEENIAAALELADWAAGMSDPEPGGDSTGSADGSDTTGAGEAGGGSGGDLGGDAADDAAGGTGTAGLSADDGALPPEFGGDDEAGCGCRSTGRRPVAPLVLLLLLAMARSRGSRGRGTWGSSAAPARHGRGSHRPA